MPTMTLKVCTIAVALPLFGCLGAATVRSANLLEPEYFAAHVHRSVPNKLWKEVGFGAIRLHDANVIWADLEPQKGAWKWDRLDAIVRNAKKAGVEVLLPLQAPPAWAASDPASIGAYGPGANTSPAHREDWTNYVATVVTRYKGLIDGYEIWNEPNLPKFYVGTPEKMAELTRQASEVIRRIDPAAKVVCASITGDYGVPWLSRYLAGGTGASCDVIGYHLYTRHQPPEVMLPTIAAVRKAMSAAGVGDKPLWNTESGWVIRISPDIDVETSGFKKDVKVLTPDEATAYIPRALLLARQAGVSRFYWYSWDHPSMGFSMGRGVGWTRPARLYSDFRRLVVGATLDACSATRATWTCNLSLASGDRLAVYWSESDATSVTAAFGGELLTIAPDGALVTGRPVRAGETVQVTPEPVFLREIR
jgi:hypothetical protein